MMDFNRKSGSYVLSLAIIFAILAGYAYFSTDNYGKAPPSEDFSKLSFKVGSIYKVSNLHPYGSSNSGMLSTPLYDCLVSFAVKKDGGRFFDYNDDLLESLELIGDGREAVAHIRKNVFFHNGAVLKAADVVYTLRKYLPQLLDRWPLLNIKDFKFEVKDDSSVKLTYSAPVDWRNIFLMQPVLNADYERSWEGKDLTNYIPMGTGPYKYSSYNKAAGVLKLERFTKYRKGVPPIGFFEYIQFKNTDAALLATLENRIDYFARISPEDQEYLASRAAATIKQEEFQDIFSFNIIFNTRNPKFSDWRVRRGISRLINRYEIVNDRYALNYIGVMADAPLHMTIPQTKPTVEPFEPAKGMKLLEEAGYKRRNGWYEKGGKRLEVEILIAKYNEGYLHILRLIERQLGLTGVLCKIKKVEWNELDASFKKRDFETVFTDLNDFTSLNIAYSHYRKNHPSNLSGYSDSVLDELFMKAQGSAADRQNKTAIQDRIREKAPAITLFYKKAIIVVNKKFLGEWFYKDPYTLSYICEAGKDRAPAQ